MYFYMSECNIPFLTSLKPRHRFTSNVVKMFLGWTPIKFVEIGVLPLFRIELLVILCIFCQSVDLKKNKLFVNLECNDHSAT